MAAERNSEELRRLAEMIALEIIADNEGAEAVTDVDEAMLHNARVDLEVARAKLGKAKLAAARLASATDRATAARRHVQLDQTAARSRLSAVITNVKPANRFTLAARDGQGVPDEDIPGLLEDAQDLGIDLDKENDSDAG